MTKLIEIKRLNLEDADKAKRLILQVARHIYGWEESVDDLVRRFAAQGELLDLDDIEGHYFATGGVFLGAYQGDLLIGTGALRPLSHDIIELKRLWLLEAYHGQGIGFRLLQALLEQARADGYHKVRLDTDAEQVRAIQFYKRVGFKPIENYNGRPSDHFMELTL